MSPLDREITITTFADRAAWIATPHVTTLRTFAERIRTTTAPDRDSLPWLKLAAFGNTRSAGGSLRNNANVLLVDGIEGDYDLGTVTVSEACVRLSDSGIAAVVYTSRSHTVAAPRWRVLCPCSDSLAPDARRALVGRLNAILGGVLARESFVLSQSYYFGYVTPNPQHAVHLIDGEYIDLVTGIEPVFPAAASTIQPLTVPTCDQPTDTAIATLTAACALFAGATGTADGRHQVLLRATSAIAPFVLAGHIDQDQAEADITAAMDESGREPYDGEVSSAMDGALRHAKPYEAPVIATDDFGVDDLTPDAATTVGEVTEDAAARAWAGTFTGRFVYDHTDQSWLEFVPDVGWQRDETKSVMRCARDFVKAARQTWGMANSTEAGRISFSSAVVRGGESDSRMAVSHTTWDTGPLCLGVLGGKVDLRTGIASPAAPADYVLRRATVYPAAPGTPAPMWLRFLHDATGGDMSFQHWLQKLAGYWLTGLTIEEILVFLYGEGGNGKGVLGRTFSAIYGEYGYQAPAELFKADGRINREYQLARLEAVRLMMVSETESGAALAESLVKELTGNEGLLNARNPYGRPFQFRPQVKLLIIGNHAPKIRARTAAMERRLRVVPFNHRPANPDPDLKDKLVVEYPAILRWMIDGCLMWQREGLGLCPAVARASAAYFEEQDTMAMWIAEACVIGPDLHESSVKLLEAFNHWLRARGEQAVNAREFKELMNRVPGVTARHSMAGRVFQGLAFTTAGSGDNALDGML